MYCIESVPLSGIKYVSLVSVSGKVSPKYIHIPKGRKKWTTLATIQPSQSFLSIPGNTDCLRTRQVGRSHCVTRKLLKNYFFLSELVKIWANLSLFYCKGFRTLHYYRCIDNQLGISAPCWRGQSSHPGLTQQREGVQGRFAPMSLGYLQARVVTMAPTAVDTMSSWCYEVS